MIGAKLGDGHAKYEGEYHCTVALAVKDHDFAEELGRCAAIVLGREETLQALLERENGAMGC